MKTSMCALFFLVFRFDPCKRSFCKKASLQECATANGGCGGGDAHKSICTNMLEGWRCACRSPAWTGDGTLCYDVDECRVGLAGCDQECVNTQGGYSCRCYPGFALDAVDRRSCAPSQSAQQDDSSSSENTWFDDAYVIAVIVLVFLSGIVLVCVAFALSRHAAAESFADEQRAEESAMLLAELPSSADGTDSSSGDEGEALFYGRDRQCGCSDPFTPRLLNWFG